ncbi:MAG: Smr/MutS family protein [Cardiobacteriaceae bacterium]|nr:Smr/MutS family protein [Cardiobacteriaceae bacterium]
MTKKESFADLIGRVTPLQTPLQNENFGKHLKILQRRRIDAQRIRHVENTQEEQHNLTHIPAPRFHALCRGKLPIAREIDLHGFYVDEALRYLYDLLDERKNRRSECWLIIHGKGRNSPHYDQAPLKQAVLNMLLQHSAVNALSSIIDQDGNSGAVFIDVSRTTIALKKKRHLH